MSLVYSPQGSVAKVNEYVVVRDLGQGTSAEVKLCRLVLPALSNGGEAVQDVPEDEKGHGDDVDGDGGGDLYVRVRGRVFRWRNLRAAIDHAPAGPSIYVVVVEKIHR